VLQDWVKLFEIRTESTEEKRRFLEEEEGGGAAMEEEEEDEDEAEEDDMALGACHDHDDGDEEEGEEAGETAGLSPLQRRVSEWVRDSVLILKALVRARLPFFVAAVTEGAAVTPASPGAAAAGGGTAGGSRTALLPHEEEALFHPSVYARLVGAFELNNIEMKIDSPLRDYLRMVSHAPAAVRAPALEALAPLVRQAAAARRARRELARDVAQRSGQDVDELLDPADADDSDDDDGEGEEAEEEEEVLRVGGTGAEAAALRLSRLPCVDGTALFSIICTMNHSCEPNVQVAYGCGDHRGMLFALRDLAAGEELCINYVDVENELPLRRADLRHYGFECRCGKCRSEGGAASAAGGGFSAF
jgi:hypothetical protein